MGFQPLSVGLCFDRQTSKGPQVIRSLDFSAFKLLGVFVAVSRWKAISLTSFSSECTRASLLTGILNKPYYIGSYVSQGNSKGSQVIRSFDFSAFKLLGVFVAVLGCHAIFLTLFSCKCTRASL